MNIDLRLSVLRRQLDERKRVNVNIHNLARTIFKTGKEVKFQAKGRDYFGKVIEVIGNPGRTQVRVQNLSTLKERDVWLEDITGLVEE